jgi:hypothetical protein
MNGKGRFELTHSTPTNSKKTQQFPPITLPNGQVVTNYTITLTFRRAQDLKPGMSATPNKVVTQPFAEITKSNYTRQEVQNNPNTAYVFTENTYSITAFPNKSGGGSAIIRPEPNAFAIVTKKKYDYNTRENVDYSDTPENFKEFTEVNTKLINELKNSGKTKIVFPQGFAVDKATMPTRFAEWLQKALLDNFGLVTELNSTKTGLISKSITQPVTQVQTEPIISNSEAIQKFLDEEFDIFLPLIQKMRGYKNVKTREDFLNLPQERQDSIIEKICKS